MHEAFSFVVLIHYFIVSLNVDGQVRQTLASRKLRAPWTFAFFLYILSD